MDAPTPPRRKPGRATLTGDGPSGPRVGFHVSAFGSSQVLAALSSLSAEGFVGLEIYADTTHIFSDRPDEFRQILDITGIGLAGVHGGGLLTSEEFREAEMAEWVRLVDWTAKAGGSYAIFYGGESHADHATDLRRAASFLNEIGRHASSLGVTLCYEPDRACPFSSRERIAALMERTLPEHVKLSADTAHLQSMGLDPALFLLSQRSRVHVVHLRDLRDPSTPEGAENPHCEMGDGVVDLESVAESLRHVAFDGWKIGVVERPSASAHESARRAAKHFREFLGFQF